jgi:hypothetical protein
MNTVKYLFLISRQVSKKWLKKIYIRTGWNSSPFQPLQDGSQKSVSRSARRTDTVAVNRPTNSHIHARDLPRINAKLIFVVVGDFAMNKSAMYDCDPNSDGRNVSCLVWNT